MTVLGYGLALLIGVVLGLLGGGGAILTVPVLVYVFGTGMKQAVPMSLVVVGLASLLGVLRHRRGGRVNLRAAAAFGPPAMAGALLGTWAALRVTGALQLTVFAVVLIAAAALMLRDRREDGAPPARRRPLPVLGLMGLAVGFLTGFIGVGGGFMYVPALTLLAGLDMKSAVGTSLALIVLSCATGLAGYLGRVTIDWPLVAGFTALAFAGVAVGSALVPRVSQQALRRGFAVFLLLMGAFVLVRGEAGARERPAAPAPSAEQAPVG